MSSPPRKKQRIEPPPESNAEVESVPSTPSSICDFEADVAARDAALLELMTRAKVQPQTSTRPARHLPRWTLNAQWKDIRAKRPEQMETIQAVKHSWRPTGEELVALPWNWIAPSDKIDLSAKSQLLLNSYANLNRTTLTIYLSQLRERLRAMPLEEIQARHDPELLLPDVYCGVRTTSHTQSRPTPETSFDREDVDAMHQMLKFVQYFGDQAHFENALIGGFSSIPSCYVRNLPRSHFPPCMTVPHEQVIPEFAVLLHNHASFSQWSKILDRNLEICLKHPALLFCIKGVQEWAPHFRWITGKPPQTEFRDINTIKRELAALVQPNLEAMIMTWQLHQESLEQDVWPLPKWLYMYGVIYDAESVIILAHIPHLELDKATKTKTYRYDQLVVDTIPLIVPVEEESGIDQTWLFERARLCVALLALQKQIFRLAAMCEQVVWPAAIRRMEERLEWDVRGFSERHTLASTRKYSKYEFDIYRDPTEEEEKRWQREEIAKVIPVVQKWLPAIKGGSGGVPWEGSL